VRAFLLLTATAALALALGCGRAPDSAPARAEVVRHFHKDPERKNGKRVLADAAEVARLAAAFDFAPAHDALAVPGDFKDWDGYMLTLHERSGGTQVLFLRPGAKSWTAGLPDAQGGRSWWAARPAAREILAKLFEEGGEGPGR
jgi:hypothetical protein